ncbi:MAG: hypothetical protein MJY66_07265, partial [Bacteroidaceae bacterium]|nr:hypothetical protein [Bacteroidaceae bacterium]
PVLAHVTKGYFEVMSEHDFVLCLFLHKIIMMPSAAANKNAEIVLFTRKSSNFLTLSVYGCV